MQEIFLTAKQVYKVDKLATEKFLIPSIILMENAGRSVADFVKRFMAKKRKNRVIVFCGPGKNGGDGFVCARYLHIWGFKVTVIIFVSGKSYSGDSLTNYKIIKKLGINIEKFSFRKTKKLVSKCDLIIDAIFGIGLSRNVEGMYYDAIKLINDSGKFVVSVDVPSGLDADTGNVLGISVVANYTLTMGALKTGFNSTTAKPYLGKVKIIDIGYPPIIFKRKLFI